MLYDSQEETQNRLLNTLVTYNGEPVWVNRVTARGKDFDLTVWPFPFNGDNQQTYRASDKAFKAFQSPPLGFCNYFGRAADCLWCERMPSRQRRQGLNNEVFNAVTLGGGHRVDFGTIYMEPAFREMIIGEYPAFDEAFDLLIPSSSIAVDREFALRMSSGGYVGLYYKRDQVGLFIRGNLFLRQDRQYLMEMIAEHKNLPDRIEVM